MQNRNKSSIDTGWAPGLLLGLFVLVGAALGSAFLLTEREPTHLRDLSDRMGTESSFPNRFVDGNLALPEIPTRLGNPGWETRIEGFLEDAEISSLRLSQNDLNRIANDRFSRSGDDLPSEVASGEPSMQSSLILGEPRVRIAEDQLAVFSRSQLKLPYSSVRPATVVMEVTPTEQGGLRVSDLYLNSARVPPPLRSILVRRLVGTHVQDQALDPLKALFATATKIEIEDHSLVFSR